MDEVFKLRDIPYYNLGILTIFLDSVHSVYSGTESVWSLCSKVRENELLKSEIRNPWRVLGKKSKNENHVTVLVKPANFFVSNLGF